MTDSVLERGRKLAVDLGLKTAYGYKLAIGASGGGEKLYYSTDDIHRLLGESVEVFGSPEAIVDPPLPEFWFPMDPRGHSHQALLIAIRPIKPADTASELLNEYLKLSECLVNFTTVGNQPSKLEALNSRAKAFLKEKL